MNGQEGRKGMSMDIQAAKERFQKAMEEERRKKELHARLKQYIERTKVPDIISSRFYPDEMDAIHASEPGINAFIFCYQLGRARGYRQAKNEAKRSAAKKA